jgi:hypothetical protein
LGHADVLERSGPLFDGLFDCESFDGRTKLYAVTRSVLEQIFGIIWVRQGSAMGQKDEIGFDAQGDFEVCLANQGGFGQVSAAGHTGCASPGDPRVEYENVRSGLADQKLCVAFVERVTDCQKIKVLS